VSRPIYGRVYEVFTMTQPPDSHAYVGMTTQTLHERVHGRSGHASPESVAEAPWKAGIRPGRAGYRLIETVYSTGDPVEDGRLLRRAEAYWIDRLRPIHNVVRPIRPPGRPVPRPPRVKRPAPRRDAVKRRRRSPKPHFLAAFVVIATYLAARLIVAMELPWPAAPWVGAPTIGAVIGWSVFWRLHRAVRKVLR
jgi:hypothetical protein